MRRFWFEFEDIGYEILPAGIAMGCGVTAEDLDGAKVLLRNKVFKNMPIPQIIKTIEDVDVSALDAHVVPNMNPPNLVGVWFPLGYD